MTEERKAIVKYLRDVAELYAEAPHILGEGDETRGRVSDVLEVCAKDVEELHPDTCPTTPAANLVADARAIADEEARIDAIFRSVGINSDAFLLPPGKVAAAIRALIDLVEGRGDE